MSNALGLRKLSWGVQVDATLPRTSGCPSNGNEAHHEFDPEPMPCATPTYPVEVMGTVSGQVSMQGGQHVA